MHIIPQDQVHKAVTEGFIQAKDDVIASLGKGDQVISYSPRSRFRKGSVLQEFTAIGTVQDEESYQGDSKFRRRMAYSATTNAPIEPLVGKLSFLPEQERWELPYSKGLFEIEKPDFECIAQAMACEV